MLHVENLICRYICTPHSSIWPRHRQNYAAGGRIENNAGNSSGMTLQSENAPTLKALVNASRSVSSCVDRVSRNPPGAVISAGPGCPPAPPNSQNVRLSRVSDPSPSACLAGDPEGTVLAQNQTRLSLSRRGWQQLGRLWGFFSHPGVGTCSWGSSAGEVFFALGRIAESAARDLSIDRAVSPGGPCGLASASGLAPSTRLLPGSRPDPLSAPSTHL